jgi:hypothetical protein
MQCKYCGRWSGLFENEHLDCANAYRDAQAPQSTIAGVLRTVPAAAFVGAQSQPITIGKIAAGVLIGNLLTALIVGFIGLGIRALFH